MKNRERIMSALLNEPWLIQASWLEKIIAIAMGEGDLEALKTKSSGKLDGADRAFVRENISHIPITGPIFPRANLMTDVSGATSVAGLALDLQAAFDDDSIESIILDIDSPGGAVTGINELGNLIKNSPKHITAYVSGTGASAAYWLASAADEVVLDDTARVGSIGVVMAIPKPDDTKVEIVSSQSPDKRPNVMSDEGKNVLQREVDALADVFVSTVATNRNVSEEVVLLKFGKGSVLVGKDAVTAGMADRLGSFEGLMTEKTQTDTGGVTMLTMEQLQKEHPDLYQAILDKGMVAGKAEGAQLLADMTSERDTAVTENGELQATIVTLETENAANGKRLSALERKDVVRSEADITKDAGNIITVALADSSIKARLHPKVRQGLSHDAFVTDGVFNAAGFKAHVETDILSWEEDLSAEESVQGLDTGGDKETGGATDAVADRMFAHVN